MNNLKKKKVSQKISSLIVCDWCKNGCGTIIYNSIYINGSYCTSDHYANAVNTHFGFGGLIGDFDIKSDGHRGVYLVDKHTT